MSKTNTAFGMILLLAATLAFSGCGDDRGSEPLPAPADIAWEHMGSASYVRVSEFAFGPGGTIFAASRGGGVYRSMDAGESWSAANNGLPNESVQCIAVTGDGDAFVGLYEEGVYRSTDNGETWEAVNNGLFPVTTVNTIAIDSGGKVFLGMSSRTYRSADNGESWESFTMGEAGSCYAYDIVVSPTGDIFASCSGKGVFRSTDSSESWTLVADTFYCDPNPNAYDSARLSIDGAGTIYALIINGWCLNRSTDGGENWHQFPVASVNDEIMGVTVSETGTIYVGTSNDGVYCSHDDGETWNQINDGLWESHIGAIQADGHGAVYVGSSSGGMIYRYRESEGEWRQVNDAMPADARFVFFSSRETILAGTRGNLYRSSDHGASWKPSSEGMGSYAACLAENAGGVIFAGTAKAGVFRSDDDGLSWSAANTGMENTTYMYDIVVDPHGAVIASEHELGVVRSSDGGRTWLNCNDGIENQYVLSFLVGGNAVYAGTYDHGIYRYNPNSHSWSPFSEGLTNPHPTGLAFMPPHTLYAGTRDGVFATLDYGGSWRPVPREGLTSTCMKAMAVSDAHHLYAVARCPGSIFGGVFRWIPAKDAWEQIGQGLPKNVYDLSFDHERYLYASTSGGIFRTAEPTY